MRAMKRPVMNSPTQVLLRRGLRARSRRGRSRTTAAARAPSRAGGSRARSRARSTARRARASSRPRWPRSAMRDRAERRQREREAVQPRRADAGRRTARRRTTSRTMPSAPCIMPYGPKRPLPESVPRVDVRDVVRRRCAMSSATSSSVSPWNSSSMSRRRDDQRRRAPTAPARIAAEDRGPLHERAAADALRAPVRERPARPPARAAGRSPGATTKTIAHRPLSAAYSAVASSWRVGEDLEAVRGDARR